jgi:hypothetical protein
VLSHKHPEDYEQVAATLEDIRRTHKPFSTRHRIITVAGATREVVVIGDRMHDNAGRVIGTQGFYIDVTPPGEIQAAIISEAVAEIAENRAPIEQAKCILMLVYRIQADAAFDLLKWRSQEEERQAADVGRTADRRRGAPWNTAKPYPRDRHSTGCCSPRTNACGRRRPVGIPEIMSSCGGAVRRPAWIRQNRAAARKLTGR